MTPFLCGVLIGALLGACLAVLGLGLCAMAHRRET